MSYLLEHRDESERLEQQNKQSAYSIEEELCYLSINPNDKVLDAGCGAGTLSRFLIDKFNLHNVSACDHSEIRIQQAKVKSKNYQNIHFSQANIEMLPYEEEVFDYVICRLVYEYLDRPIEVTKEFRRVLKPGGKAYLIDVDGLFFNIWTSNQKLNTLLEKLKRGISIDLFVGRKLPIFLSETNFSNIVWNATVHRFNNHEELKQERINNIDRLRFSKDAFSKILGGDEVYNEFMELYLEEMMNMNNTLFFNKIIAVGQK
ncbi:MAG: class I SAM-dependent methyltransferase [Bacteriovoracaceae bacterium]|nr:class I SAM-dependent methyltransferase [Bacteriovoracaceae bacterium]